jgi:apolipoprotein N-acyltransferase
VVWALYWPQTTYADGSNESARNAKPLMRGTNNGISALVDHKGRIYQLAEQHKIAALSGIVQPRIGATIFSKLRSWPIIFIALLICIVLVRARKQH